MKIIAFSTLAILAIGAEYHQLSIVPPPPAEPTGGCANKLFFSGLDVETCGYVERALGQSTEYDTVFQGISEYARTVASPLLRTDEIRMLKSNKGILISGRHPPALLPIPPFYEVPTWRKQTCVSPTLLPKTTQALAKTKYLAL